VSVVVFKKKSVPFFLVHHHDSLICGWHLFPSFGFWGMEFGLTVVKLLLPEFKCVLKIV